MAETGTREQKDWLGGYRSAVIAWGLPIAAMIGADFLIAPLKTLIWTAALAWMGVACLANARRCGRTHCYFTGPFLLLMTIPVLLHGFDIVSLGTQGWTWLGATIVVGSCVLWCLPELALGKFIRRSE